MAMCAVDHMLTPQRRRFVSSASSPCVPRENVGRRVRAAMP